MHVFTDANRRAWEVQINVAAIRRVRAHLKLDLLDAPAGELMPRLGDDILLLVDVLHLLCRDQAAAGIDSDTFAAGISGDAFIEARQAFAAELAEFFPERPDPADTPDEDDADAKPLDALAIDQLIDRLAGIVGVNPGPFTLRQLSRMAKARQEDEWARCSYLLAKLHNCNRGPGERAVTPDELNPLKIKGRSTVSNAQGPSLGRMSIRDLRPAIMGAMGKHAQQAGMLRKANPPKSA